MDSIELKLISNLATSQYHKAVLEAKMKSCKLN